jgi:mycothiol synthase
MGLVTPGVMKCPEHAKGQALELVYRKVPSTLRERLIVQMLAEDERGETDLSGLWIATTRTGRIAGAMLSQQLVGKVAAVWAPEIRRIWRPENLATEMIQTVITDFAARGFKLVQAVVDESAGPQASRDLEKGGLPRVTEMLYLERSTSTALDSDPTSSSQENRAGRGVTADAARAASSVQSPFIWQPFGETPEPEFRKTLQATYTGSLDMPELEGARSLDEILEGYKAVGCFAPQRWRLGQIPDDPGAGAVLLLAEIPGRNVWEVLYLGLTPPARRRGLGRVVVEHALELARAHVPWLELAVDVRNTPARRLYDSAGFTAFERRAVHLKVLPGIAVSERGTE